MKKIVFALFIMLMLGAPTSSAGWLEPSSWTQNEGYFDKAFGKFEFGLLNFLGGWSEILTRPAIYTEDDKNFFVGIGHGFLNAAIFTAGGAVHLATFPIPIDIPLPGGGTASYESYG